MRTFDDVERRWTQLFNTSIGVDLRQAVRDDSSFDPCEDGLRSAFMLYGPLSIGSWTKKLAESRSAYASLRDHFLKYIDNPDNLHSSADPLDDDETDETSREEIFQDVTRCMQDNYFFREPTTQRRLLDILFIFSKLNPDTGYRQGMHEILAPILWVIDQDTINLATTTQAAKLKEGAEFMLTVLDRKYAEHDAFSLFCAVMQTAKSFYEMGENKDSSAIIVQSNRIHEELLAAVDTDLAHHLQVIGVLPQIYSILLFGREFEFQDTLRIWDLLFAENLTTEVVDMTCVAILLRVRWQLIEADYTTAITLLTRFKLPSSAGSPRTLVKDAVFLSKNKTVEAGASVVQHYSGQRPKVPTPGEERSYSPLPSQSKQNAKRWNHTRSSPSLSPARFNTPQKQLESLFSEVSGTLQRKAEGWGVSKAVRGAVGEVRRNVNNFQAGHSRETSIDASSRTSEEENKTLKKQLDVLEKRNKALAKMLDAALTSLRMCKATSTEGASGTDDAFNMALAKIQFVTVYLADSDITVPQEDETETRESEESKSKETPIDTPEARDPSPQPVKKKVAPRVIEPVNEKSTNSDNNQPSSESIQKHHKRPSLADSSFSFMLGENRHRSSFVSSVSDLPERGRRDSDARSHPKQLWEDGKENPKRNQPMADDGFTMSPLQ